MSEGPQGYLPAMPWAALMDEEDLAEFLNELGEAAIRSLDPRTALEEVERACGTWRLIAEAQHAHNTAPGPDAITQRIAPTQALQLEDPHDSPLHSPRRIPHDLEWPESGGQR